MLPYTNQWVLVNSAWLCYTWALMADSGGQSTLRGLPSLFFLIRAEFVSGFTFSLNQRDKLFTNKSVSLARQPTFS